MTSGISRAEQSTQVKSEVLGLAIKYGLIGVGRLPTLPSASAAMHRAKERYVSASRLLGRPGDATVSSSDRLHILIAKIAGWEAERTYYKIFDDEVRRIGSTPAGDPPETVSWRHQANVLKWLAVDVHDHLSEQGARVPSWMQDLTIPRYEDHYAFALGAYAERFKVLSEALSQAYSLAEERPSRLRIFSNPVRTDKRRRSRLRGLQWWIEALQTEPPCIDVDELEDLLDLEPLADAVRVTEANHEALVIAWTKFCQDPANWQQIQELVADARQQSQASISLSVDLLSVPEVDLDGVPALFEGLN